MDRDFSQLSSNEQANILNSAYSVFTDTPYDKASTNKIVELAGISKGKLFYYFKSKALLFDYLVEQAIAYVKKAYTYKASFLEKDFLERYITLSRIKQHAFEKEPYLFNFISYVYIHEKERLNPSQLQWIETSQLMVKLALKEGVDVGLFRDDLDPDLVMQLLQYSIDGYQNELTEKFKTINLKEVDLDPYYQEFDEFITSLRKVFYK